MDFLKDVLVDGNPITTQTRVLYRQFCEDPKEEPTPEEEKEWLSEILASRKRLRMTQRAVEKIERVLTDIAAYKSEEEIIQEKEETLAKDRVKWRKRLEEMEYYCDDHGDYNNTCKCTCEWRSRIPPAEAIFGAITEFPEFEDESSDVQECDIGGYYAKDTSFRVNGHYVWMLRKRYLHEHADCSFEVEVDGKKHRERHPTSLHGAFIKCVEDYFSDNEEDKEEDDEEEEE